MGFSGQDHQICYMLKHFDMPADALDDLRRFIKSAGGAMDDAHCDPFHRDLLTELSNGTWFLVDGSAQLTQTHGGSRPGDGLADMIFGFIFSQLLRKLNAGFAEAAVQFKTPGGLNVTWPPVVLIVGYASGHSPQRHKDWVP